MPTDKPIVNSANAWFKYYDIESLPGIFTLVIFDPRTNQADLYYLVEKGTTLFNKLRQVDPDKFLELLLLKVRYENPALKDKPEQPAVIKIYNLDTKQNNINLINNLGGVSNSSSVNNPNSYSTIPQSFRPVCDTDPEYDPINTHPYLCGYNSNQYDTVMLALYFNELFGGTNQNQMTPVSAQRMRDYNDALFANRKAEFGMASYLTNGKEFKEKGFNSSPNLIRKALLQSGRHLDIARLNETNSKVGLKRLLGGGGYQILESSKLSGHGTVITTISEFIDLLAYNVSDTVGLWQQAQHPVYTSAFDLKKGLLDQYPETIYEKLPDSYSPDIRPEAVRSNRLTPDSTSARFVGLILSPYSTLTDIQAVSLMYPHPLVAKEMGIESRDILDESKEFFFKNITDEKARAQFMNIYNYYADIRGKNFNDSPKYQDDYQDDALVTSYLSEITRLPNNIPYFDKNGEATTGFATFSTGGIHGAEYDIFTYSADLDEYLEWDQLIDALRRHHLVPLELRQARLKGLEITLPSGKTTTITYKDVLTSSTRVKDLEEWMEAHNQLEGDYQAQLDLADTYATKKIGWKTGPNNPHLFRTIKKGKAIGATSLDPKYAYTSVGEVIHEDFASYYPNLLRNMRAFYNEDLGEDRYALILADKDRYQDLAKQAKKAGNEIEAARYNLLREGTKLILNSASGAADTNFPGQPIRVNNQIISMRLLGQLFSWRIGQAQTLAGGLIVSTNTDGLYSLLNPEQGFTEEVNNRVLAEQARQIHVKIDPEQLLLVSKDSNNRLEMQSLTQIEDNDPHQTRIFNGSGGTLACHTGPRPDKNLAHSAVIDWALARYLRYCATGYSPTVSIDLPLDEEVGRKLLEEARHLDDPVFSLRLFQIIIAASSGMWTFPFASDPLKLNEEVTMDHNPKFLQHYNRVFFVKPNTPSAVSLQAGGAWKISPASVALRKKEGLSPIAPPHPVSLMICEANGFTNTLARSRELNMELLPDTHDIQVRKITNIEPHWNALIENRDLHQLDPTILSTILESLDLDIYLEMLSTKFNKNWSNAK